MMKPEMILKADMLDILFENRNKSYGAYELRRYYNGRLYKATGSMLGIVLLFVGINFWKMDGLPESNFINSIPPDVKINTVEIEKPVIPEPPKKNIATIKSLTPIIVPDNVKADPPPTQTDLEDPNKAIGTATVDGDPPNGVQPVLEGNGLGKEIATPAVVEKEPEILTHAQFNPEFPGGVEAMRRYLLKNLRFDFDDMEPGSRVEIRCKFVVDKEGVVTGIEIIKSGGRNEFDKEVTRVVAKMPNWKPGIQNGRNVAVYFTLPVVVVVPEQ